MVDETPPGAAAPPAGTPTASPSEVAPPETSEEDWATRFKYLLADFENFRRRSVKEREAARLQARAEVIRSLLPVYEAALRARDAAQHLPKSDPLRKGVELLAREWEAFLDSERIRPVAKVGAPFEPEVHEAIAEAPPRPGIPAGSVAEVIQQGYRIDSAVLRPAKVAVARSPAAGAHSTEAAAASPGSASEDP